jgi:hypothetical protein
MFVVQREACGLRDGRAVMRDYKVPDESAAVHGGGHLNASRKVTSQVPRPIKVVERIELGIDFAQDHAWPQWRS